MVFRDRTDAGARLAGAFADVELVDPVVLALPRGGVPVAFEVARALGAPLDVLVARKVGAPGHPEFGIGAIGELGSEVRDEPTIELIGLSDREWAELVRHEHDELRRRVARYRGDRGVPELEGRDVIVVDDGLATGVTAEAALRDVRGAGPHRSILAVPVCAPDTARRLRAAADEVVCVHAPSDFRAVGQWYERFEQTTDEEVMDLLARALHHTHGER